MPQKNSGNVVYLCIVGNANIKNLKNGGMVHTLSAKQVSIS